MKNILEKTLFTSILVFLVACNFSKNDTAVDNRLFELVKGKDYFKLRTELDFAKKSLSKDRYLFYKTICDDVFNDVLSSQKCVDILFDKYNEQLPDSVKKDLLAIKIRNYIRQSEYSNVVNTCQLLLNEYDYRLDSLEKVKYKDTQSLFEKLINVKPLVVHKNGSFEIQSRRNPYLNLIMLPVTKGGTTANFMLDTGADFSVITRTCAQEMGLTIYETNTDIETAVGTIKANVAVADSLYVGDILFENVIFMVMPLFSIPELDFKMNGIIGVKEMRKLEEIHIRKDGSMFIPETYSNRKLSNMYLDNLEGLSLTVQIQSNKDTLLMEFDTGANVSNLTKKYYDKHQEQIAGNLNNKSVLGASSKTQQKESYTLTNFSYTIGTKSNILPKIDIELSNEKYDGLLGQDMILPFDKMIINFKNMYVNFE